MAFSKFRTIFPTIILILVCILFSIVALNFFQIDMEDNTGFRVVNRKLTVEGMKNKKNKKEGMCNSGKHKKGECGHNGEMCTLEGMTIMEGAKNKKDDESDDESDDEEEAEEEAEEDVATLGAFASNIMT